MDAAGQVTEDKHRIVEPKMPKARGLEESHRWELVEAAVRCGVHGLPSPEEDAKVEMAVGWGGRDEATEGKTWESDVCWAFVSSLRRPCDVYVGIDKS